MEEIKVKYAIGDQDFKSLRDGGLLIETPKYIYVVELKFSKTRRIEGWKIDFIIQD